MILDCVNFILSMLNNFKKIHDSKSNRFPKLIQQIIPKHTNQPTPTKSHLKLINFYDTKSNNRKSNKEEEKSAEKNPIYEHRLSK